MDSTQGRKRPLHYPSPKCDFTGPPSVDGNVGGKAVCDSTVNDCYVICPNCNHQNSCRCFLCYKRINEAISKITVPKKGKMHCNDATRVSLHIDWDRCNKDKDIPEDITIIEDGKEKELKVPIKRHDDHDNIFEWTIDCPCCGDKKLQEEPELPLREELTPRGKNFQVLHIKVEQQVVGSTKKEKSYVELVIVEPLVTRDEVSVVQHHGLGPGDGVCHVFHSRPTHWGPCVPNVHRIIATRNPEDETELLVLSCIKYDVKKEIPVVHHRHAYVKMIQTAVSPSLEKKQSGPTNRRRKLCENEGNIKFCHLRNNRTNGASGTCNGMHLQDLQVTQSSPNLWGATCRHRKQHVTIAIENENKQITKVHSLYHASRENKFTSKIQTSCATKGCEAKGSNVVDTLLNRNHQYWRGDQQKRIDVEELHKRFTKNRILAAFLNKALEDAPQLKEMGYKSVSRIATKNILETWENTLYLINNLSEDNGSNISSDAEGLQSDDFDDAEKEKIRNQPAYEQGENLLYRVEGEWLRYAVVEELLEDRSVDGERRYKVMIGDEERTIGEYHLSGEPGEGKYCDDEVPKADNSECRAIIFRLLKTMKKDGTLDLYQRDKCLALLLWSARGNYNAVFDSVSCHVDNFGAKSSGAVEATLENAIDIPLGELSEGKSLPPCGSLATFDQIPGALLLPRLGVATIRDRFTEILELHSEYHCVIRSEKKSGERVVEKKSSKQEMIEDAISRVTYDRSCWFQGKWYPEGASVLDWESRYSGNSATAVSYRTRRSAT